MDESSRSYWTGQETTNFPVVANNFDWIYRGLSPDDSVQDGPEGPRKGATGPRGTTGQGARRGGQRARGCDSWGEKRCRYHDDDLVGPLVPGSHVKLRPVAPLSKPAVRGPQDLGVRLLPPPPLSLTLTFSLRCFHGFLCISALGSRRSSEEFDSFNGAEKRGR